VKVKIPCLAFTNLIPFHLMITYIIFVLMSLYVMVLQAGKAYVQKRLLPTEMWPIVSCWTFFKFFGNQSELKNQRHQIFFDAGIFSKVKLARALFHFNAEHQTGKL